ncbi:MAG: hypothetical protein IJH41_03970 [Eubacterium sp.]|nr:hypothetical protein [Eubacterium sp.]MBQ4458014.1 hypothetical protein [Clostridia bacterium]
MAQSKNINMEPGTNGFEIWFSQGDIGVQRTLNLINGRTGGFYEVPTGATVKIVGTKPSGFGFNETVTFSGHTITVTATQEMTDEHGYIECEIRVTKDGMRLGGQNGHLGIERDPHPDSTTDGNAEEVISELTLIMEQIHEDVEKAEVLSEAEAWAVGQRDGVDVPSTDPTYHNNSKYYKEAAALSAASAGSDAQGAAGSASAAAGSASSATAAKTAAETAQGLAEAAAEAAASVFAVVGNVTFSVLENGQVRETWTEEE